MLTVGQVAENCFVIRRDGADRGVIVDPGEEAERILAVVDELGIGIDAILLTHTHFDHIGAVAPVARATGAPVYCPEIEVPVLRDIMAFVPWPGFGPYESYEADETVAGGETLELAGMTIEVVFTPGPQPGPRHLRDPRRGRAVQRRRPLPGLGRARRPARRRLADAAREHPRPRRRLPGGDDRLPRTHGDHDARRRARDQPVPGRARSLGSPRCLRASRPRRGTFDILPADAERRAADQGGGGRAVRAGRLRADRDPGVRGHRAVRARRGRGHRHRPQGDVHVHRPGRPQPHAAPGGDRRDLPRVRRARHAPAAPAGEALVLGTATFATSARRPAASASSTRSTPR